MLRPDATLILVVSSAALLLLLLWLLRELRRLRSAEPSAAMLLLQREIDALREQVRASLEGGRLAVDRRLEETHRVVAEVRQGLGEVDRQVRFVTEAAKDLRGLQELLRSPKLRGEIGEYLLAELLAQVLPQAHFSLQHELSSGERVDAVLRLGPRMLAVDAKFPLDNFHRMREAAEQADAESERRARRRLRSDVRRHVEAIARRYVRPAEGTYDFAMMYLPAEAVYQELLQQEGEDALDLFHYALSRKVVPVSPQSFFAYLQVILLGLRGLTLEGRTREVLAELHEVEHRLGRLGEAFAVAGRHLLHAQGQMETAGRELERLRRAFRELTEDGPASAPQAERPAQKRQDPPMV